MIRLYGHLAGSFRVVSEGLKLAFEEHGVLAGYVVGEQEDFDSAPIPGADARIAVVAGSPLRAMLAHRRGAHEQVWLMLAPNSNGIPPHVVRGLCQEYMEKPLITGFLVPSRWAMDVVQREFPNHPVVLCPHGVLPEFSYRERRLPSSFEALHVTSTNTKRKGTRELLEAWGTFMSEHPEANLRIFANPHHVSELMALVVDLQTPAVSIFNGQNLPAAQWADCYRAASVVVQPSRAEGFGLVPLEALACGVPGVATMCTGHEQYFDDERLQEAVHFVVEGPDGESDDYLGAMAPTVSSAEVLRALEAAYTHLTALTEAAEKVAPLVSREWTWANGAREFVERVNRT